MLRLKKPCLESLIDYYYFLFRLRYQEQGVIYVEFLQNLRTENLNEFLFPGKFDPLLLIIHTMKESHQVNLKGPI